MGPSMPPPIVPVCSAVGLQARICTYATCAALLLSSLMLQANTRPIAFEIPRHRSKALTDGQPTDCHPPTGQFAAAIGKRKTAVFEKGKTQPRATRQNEQHCPRKMWKSAGKTCGWKHPKAPSISLLYGGQEAILAILTFLRETKSANLYF